MKFGIALPNFGRYAQKESILDVAESAEDLGFDSLWVSDHIIIPESHEGFGDVFYDPLATLSFVAAKTRSIQLGTSVIILPYRNPIVLAKMISTLDVLCGGRLTLGVGVGWLEDEFDALGVSYIDRGPITDECIDVLKNLWSNEEPSYRGRYFNFSNIKFFPKPIQKPHPPLWIGGNGLVALRRAIMLGNGWHPVGLTAGEIQEKRRAVGELQSENRSSNFVISLRKNLQIYKSKKKKPDVSEPLRDTPEMISKGIELYAKSGVSHLVFQILSGRFEDIIHTMEFFSTKIRPSLILK
ncbi:MAG: LLM class F420-dependent oxidoreductase [Thermodesulfobacteriota bacterium]